MQTFNRPSSRSRRQHLRNHMPEPERRLWYYLRNQRLGVKFRRQHGVGPYIVDFYCPALKLAIEVDGESHFQDGAALRDLAREGYLRALGLTVLRFRNDEVMGNIEGVFMRVEEVVASLRDPL